MLLFKKKFLPAIRTGEKVQTVRLWPYPRMRAGQRSYIPGAGYILIDAVDEVQLADLSDGDAQLDGFPSAAALRREIRDIYADQLKSGHRTFRVRFHLLPPAEQEAAKQNRTTRKTPQKRGPTR